MVARCAHTIRRTGTRGVTRGDTPLRLALRRGRAAVAELLEQAALDDEAGPIASVRRRSVVLLSGVSVCVCLVCGGGSIGDFARRLKTLLCAVFLTPSSTPWRCWMGLFVPLYTCVS